jgi:uncharacterized protein YbaP (TraB family)
MLWEISRVDKGIHYIFGTLHTATKEAYSYTSLAKKYLLLSDVYIAEMNIDHMSVYDMTNHFLSADGQLFSDHFKPKHFEKYCRVVKKTFSIDLSVWQKYTVFYINNLLADQSIRKSRNEPLDHYLWNFAKENFKSLDGLETLEEQIGIMNQIPIDFQLKSFKNAVANVQAFKHSIKTIQKMYAEGDLKALYGISKKSMGGIRKLMIYDRNVIMTERIDQRSKPENVIYFAVGAAHLPGNKGILALLKSKGYRVKALID